MNARSLHIFAPLLGVLCLWGCAEDTILPAGECGNGVREGVEQCDTGTEGCADCRPSPGFECVDNICGAICGDGIVAGDEACDDLEDPDCSSTCQIASARTGCDMTGYWIIRQSDFSVDDIFGGLLQTSSNWYIMEVVQDGEDFEVKKSLNCGIQVTGSVNVNLNPEASRRLMVANPQGSDNKARPPRRGISRLDGEVCTFEMERWYLLRGLEEDAGASIFLPEDFSELPELDSLPPLPDVSDEQRTSDEIVSVEGADDWDGDGRDGLAWDITGAISGVRNSIQRDWTEVFSDDEFRVAPGSDEFVCVSRYNGQENILHATNGLLLAGSVPAPGIKGRGTFRFLGQDLGEPPASDIIVGPLGEDIDQDVETCTRVLEALPHIDSKDFGIEL